MNLIYTYAWLFLQKDGALEHVQSAKDHLVIGIWPPTASSERVIPVLYDFSRTIMVTFI